MRKDIPNPKLYDTLAPDMNYIYFEHGEEFPFDIKVSGYSPVNAWWLADASFLAYCHPGFCRMAYYIAGFREFHFFNGPGTECMVASSDEMIIVSFRGTEINSRSVFVEVGTDLNTLPVDFPEGGEVHQGFLLALEEVWEQKDEEYQKKYPKHHSGLEDYLRGVVKEHPHKPMYMCGHSLGGALATLCFAKIQEAKALYIYGAPRVGDDKFLELLGDRDVFRIEHASDPVPYVPPQIKEIKFNFTDTGSVVHLNRDGELAFERPQLERPETMLETIKKEKKLPEIKDIADLGDLVKERIQVWSDFLDEVEEELVPKVEDHMPVYYAVKLWNLLIEHETSGDQL